MILLADLKYIHLESDITKKEKKSSHLRKPEPANVWSDL